MYVTGAHLNSPLTLTSIVLTMGLRNGSLVCDHCSSTVFTFNSFQIAWAAKDSSDSNAGFSYTTQTWQEIDDGENKGCNWCDVLWGEIPFWYKHRKKKEWPMPEETFEITVRFEKRDSEDNIVLRVVVENDWASTYHVQCDPGTQCLVLSSNMTNFCL